MFITKKTLDSKLEYAESRLNTLENQYWSLWHKHELLLKHLGLTEHKIPELVELRTKGGPERGY